MEEVFVIADACSLIGFARAERLEMLHELFERICAPPSVVAEIQRTVAIPPWLEILAPDDSITLPPHWPNLGDGETDALRLAMQFPSSIILSDDRQARYYAERSSLKVMGSLRVLVIAKQAGLIETIRPSIDALQANGLYLSDRVIELALRAAGEEI